MRRNKIEVYNNFTAFICLILYRLMLDFAYFQVIYPEWKYIGFQSRGTVESFVVSWTVFVLPMPFFIKLITDRENRISSIVMVLLILLSYIPFTTLVGAQSVSNEYVAANVVYWTVLIMLQTLNMRKPIKGLPKMRMGTRVLNDRVVSIIGAFSLLLVVYISAQYTHFRMNFNLFAVYKLRAEAATYNFPTIIGYAFSWTKAINPVLLGYSLTKKRKLNSALLFLTQLLSFGIDGQKSTFFFAILVVLMVWLYTGQPEKYFVLYGVLTVSILGNIENMLFAHKHSYVIELVIRRMMFVTNYLGYCYYDFFMNHTPDFFKGSFLRFFGFKSQYNVNGQSIGTIIGEKYISSGVNCNNGLISDALANLGIFGVIIMPFILVYVLRMFDKSVLGKDKRITIVVALYVAIILQSSFLMTALITHGLVALIIVLSMIEKKDNMSEV